MLEHPSEPAPSFASSGWLGADLPLMRCTMCVALSAIALSLGSCSQEADDTAGTASQVVARVNGSELTTHQVNAALQHVKAPAGVDPTQVRREIVERLIEEQLAVDKALSLNLDRDPEVLQQLEQARRAILAKAYLQRHVSGLPAPSLTAIRDFYDKNPALFSKRRRYHLAELAVEADTDRLDDYVRHFRQPDGSLDEISSRLRDDGAEPLINSLIRNPEDLPAPFVERLAKMKVGDKLYYRIGNVVHFVELRGIEDAPVSEVRARPRIEAYLLSRAQARIVRNEIAALRRTAKIEYRSGLGPAEPILAEHQARSADNSADDARLQQSIEGL